MFEWNLGDEIGEREKPGGYLSMLSKTGAKKSELDGGTLGAAWILRKLEADEQMRQDERDSGNVMSDGDCVGFTSQVAS